MLYFDCPLSVRQTAARDGTLRSKNKHRQIVSNRNSRIETQRKRGNEEGREFRSSSFRGHSVKSHFLVLELEQVQLSHADKKNTRRHLKHGESTTLSCGRQRKETEAERIVTDPGTSVTASTCLRVLSSQSSSGTSSRSIGEGGTTTAGAAGFAAGVAAGFFTGDEERNVV